MWHRRTPLAFIFAFTLFCSWISFNSCQGLPPVITQHPSDVVVVKNSPADLKCVISELPSKATIFWLHDGVKVQDDGRRYVMPDGTLHFLRVVRSRKRTDVGIYQCGASNTFGTVYSKNVSLMIGSFKSTFRSEPESQSTFTGETVVLQCSPPKGRPLATVSWLHDGVEISNSSRMLISTKGNLTISSVTKADQGSYVCRAVHPLGTRDSQKAVLTVKEYVNPLTVVPTSQVGLTGNNTTFQCRYRDRDQDKVTWEKKNGSLPSGRHFVDSGKLTITDIDFQDKGTYICKVNTGSRELTVEASLDVKSKPKIIQAPEDAIANEGSSAKFTCVAVGEPQPTVFWDSEGKSRPPMLPNQNYLGRIFVSRSGELQITNVQKEDDGVYICTALSPNGNTKAKAQLTVIGPTDVLPSVVSGPANKSVDEGNSVKFSCDVIGSPDPSVSWFQHDDIIPLQNSSSVVMTQSGKTFHLSIINVSLSDQGKVKCVATSSIGTDSKEAELFVKKVIITTTPPPTTTPTPEPTLPSLDLVATSASHNSVSLVWSSVSLPDASNVIYVVEHRKTDSNQQWVVAVTSLKDKYTVHHLDPDTTYVFNVKAVNQNGVILTQGLKQVKQKTDKKPVVLINPSPSLHPDENLKIDVQPFPMGSDKINVTWTFSRPVSISSVVISWQKKDSNKKHNNTPDTVPRYWYLLTGLEANTSYEIQVQVMSEDNSVLISDPVFATTPAEAGIVIGGGTGVSATDNTAFTNHGEVSVVEAQAETGDTWYKMKLFMRQPWFIGTMGAVAWVILLIVVALLYRQRRSKRKAKTATTVSVPADNKPRSSTV